MMPTIRHQDSGVYVVIAKLLTGYVKVSSKVTDIDSYIKVNGLYDADYVAYVVSWQGNHGCTPNGEIGPDEWTAIAKAAPTCSTSKNRTSGYTLALQLALGGNLTPDAIYGPRTKAAVATYQDAQGLDADGICGQQTWNSLIVGEAKPQPTPGTFTQPVDYKQGAKPWGPRMYSNHNDHHQTMANSGCGPTACADAIATLKDPTVDPWTLAQLAMEWGDRTYNSGTAWTFFKHVAEHYGFSKFVQSGSYSALTACLDAGGYVVCSMKKGYWTNGGHFICAWKYYDTYTYANDPASSSRKKQKTAQFKSECKQYFCFYPDEKPEPAKEPTSNEVKRGEKICDVSKFQGTINWDTLAPELAFVVIKASGLYRYGADTQYLNNVKGAVSHGVPWHTYTFLYCKTAAEVKRDAKLYFDTVSSGGHWPLFWCLDLEAGWGAPNKDVPMLAEDFEGELRRLCKEHGPGEIKVSAYVAQEKYYDWSLDYDHYAYLWIPGYGEKYRPKMPCDIWQYTSTGKLPGIAGNVDLDVLMGTKPMSFLTGGEM